LNTSAGRKIRQNDDKHMKRVLIRGDSKEKKRARLLTSLTNMYENYLLELVQFFAEKIDLR
jgi:hypothetical protein